MAAVQVVLHNVTERKLEESELRQSEEKFAAAFEAAPDMIGISRLGDSVQTALILNLSATEELLQQTVGCAPSFAYSMSVRARSSAQTTVALLIGNQRRTITLSGQWQDYQFSAVPGGAADQVMFAIAIPMGGSVELSGVHAEFGACSPEYRKSDGRQGLFTKARFKDDVLVVRCEEGGIVSVETTVVAGLVS